jgi:hypothetical protein
VEGPSPHGRVVEVIAVPANPGMGIQVAYSVATVVMLMQLEPQRQLYICA